MASISFQETELKGVLLVSTFEAIDNRGTFFKPFSSTIFEKEGLAVNFKENYYSYSR